MIEGDTFRLVVGERGHQTRAGQSRCTSGTGMSTELHGDTKAAAHHYVTSGRLNPRSTRSTELLKRMRKRAPIGIVLTLILMRLVVVPLRNAGGVGQAIGVGVVLAFVVFVFVVWPWLNARRSMSPKRGTVLNVTDNCDAADQVRSAALTSSHSESRTDSSSCGPSSMPWVVANASTTANRVRNLPAARRRASSASAPASRAALTRRRGGRRALRRLFLITVFQGGSQLVELLADLVQQTSDVVPVEADLGCLALQLLGVRQAPAGRWRLRRTASHAVSRRV